MENKEIYVMLSEICKALANPLRIEILEILNFGEMSFGDILKRLNISKSNLSQHLSLLVSQGLVLQRREGTNTFFCLSSAKAAQACGIMREMIEDNLKSKLIILKSTKLQ